MISTDIFQRLTGDEEADAPDEARNGLRHVASLSMTKLADGLIDPKLVLSWLLTALGAPAVYAGALVPIREAGALLPQVAMAGWVSSLAQRKWAWVLGSIGQGIGAALIVFFALTLEGSAAGISICAALALLAISRALCSVSYKDILGRTIEKTRRGAITGFAGSASSVGVVLFAILLISGVFQNRTYLIAGVALAAFLWFFAAALFSRMEEQGGAGEPKASAANFAILKDNPQLWRFITVRGLLVSTALAPPYLVILSGSQDDAAGLGALGALLLASALASFASSWVWGRFADQSSRKVLMASGIGGAIAIALAILLAALGLAQTVWAMPVTLFALMIAYHGVRQGRSTYLVDMAPEADRAAYAAVSNTIIGSILLFTGVVGGAAALLGPLATLVLFACMAGLAAVAAIGLEEVEEG